MTLRNSREEITETVLRPEAYDIKERADRVGKYYRKYTESFVFDEFGTGYIKRTGMEFMAGVPIPLKKDDLVQFKGGEELKIPLVVENMAWIMGINPKFAHVKHYLEFMGRCSDNKIVDALVQKGRDAAREKQYDHAAIHFRAALCISPANLSAMNGYAEVCRELYLESNDEEIIGRYKAEAMEYFELVTLLHPQYAQAYYYLGYAYLNMGLYVKAKLTWEQFLEKSDNEEDNGEIQERLRQLEHPVQIERGYNAVLSGRYEEGIQRMEPYLKSRFKEWWPMSYYLGIAYLRTDHFEDAAESFKRVLAIHPSHVESMEELADIYAQRNDRENESKYRKKADLLRSGGHK